MNKHNSTKPKECPFCGGVFIVRNHEHGKWQCLRCKNFIIPLQKHDVQTHPEGHLYNSDRYKHSLVAPKERYARLRSFKWLIPVLLSVFLLVLTAFTSCLFTRDNPLENNSPQSQTSGQIPSAIELSGSPFKHFEGINPPYSKNPLGDSINLISNPDASDPTWQQLLDFLRYDLTDQNPYLESSYLCGSFAEDIHNNAENLGIRSAWVAIDFADRSTGHACNAFYTIDMGLVFIDCTGSNANAGIITSNLPEGSTLLEQIETNKSHDKTAYIELGNEYGVISIDYASSPYYSFYEEYIEKRAEYDAEAAAYSEAVASYNEEVDSYNTELDGRTELQEPEYSYFKKWFNELTSQRVKLEKERSGLEELFAEIGAYFWEPMGIVSNVEIYW